MDTETQILNEIKKKSISLFVKKDVDINSPNVIAAITDAARNMALVSDIATLEDTQIAVLKAFGASENNEIIGLVDVLNPSYIKFLIGFSTDYRDYNSAKVLYDSQKKEYDALYDEVNSLRIEHERNL